MSAADKCVGPEGLAARLAACAIVLGGPATAAPARPPLTDAALADYAARPFDKRAKMNRQEVLGVLHGVRVVADFPCSDVCPDYTTRVIHFAIEPGPACAQAGGVTVRRRVPYSIAMIEKSFCVPKVVADRNL